MPSLTTLHLSHLSPNLSIHIAFYTNVHNAPFLHAQLLAGNPDFDYAFINASLILSPPHLLSAVFRACLLLLPLSQSPLSEPASLQPPPRQPATTTPTPPQPAPTLPPTQLSKSRPHSSTHANIILALGTTPNIASTLRTFGISPETKHVCVVKIASRDVRAAATSSSQEAERLGNDDGSCSSEEREREKMAKFLTRHVEGELRDFTQENLDLVMDVPLIRKIYKFSTPPNRAGKPDGLGGMGKGGKKGGKAGRGERRRERIKERETMNGGGMAKERGKDVREEGGDVRKEEREEGAKIERQGKEGRGEQEGMEENEEQEGGEEKDRKGGGDRVEQEEERTGLGEAERREMERLILGMMALRGAG